MKVLVTGASGYVGSAVARALLNSGHHVFGLARTAGHDQSLRAAGLEPVTGDFDNLERLAQIVRAMDATIIASLIPFDEEYRRKTVLLPCLVRALAGTGKTLIYTSGTTILSRETEGEWLQESYAEDDPFTPSEWMAPRVIYERCIRDAAQEGVRAMVVRAPLLWGRAGSKQIPWLFDSVRKVGAACYIGRGLNLHSHVNIDDLGRLYALAVERGVAGALYHAVGGEENFRSLAEAVARVAQCETRSVSFEEACTIWDPFVARIGFNICARSRSPRSKVELGWTASNPDIVKDIVYGSYREEYERGAVALRAPTQRVRPFSDWSAEPAGWR
jgi:nucleoside-diphosphate-sugar epimerase